MDLTGPSSRRTLPLSCLRVDVITHAWVLYLSCSLWRAGVSKLWSTCFDRACEYFNDWEKIEKILSCEVKITWNSNFGVCIWSFIITWPHSFFYILSIGALSYWCWLESQQTWYVASKPKSFTMWLFTEKFVAPDIKEPEKRETFISYTATLKSRLLNFQSSY